MPCQLAKQQRKVSFNAIEIIELPYAVGDGPATGVPISVGWEVQERSVFSIDFFEQYRPRRRPLEALRLSNERRQYLLLKNGASSTDILNASMESERMRKDRALTLQQMCTLREVRAFASSERSRSRKFKSMTPGSVPKKARVIPARSA